jgi:hypothetical protein
MTRVIRDLPCRVVVVAAPRIYLGETSACHHIWGRSDLVFAHARWRFWQLEGSQFGFHDRVLGPPAAEKAGSSNRLRTEATRNKQ